MKTRRHRHGRRPALSPVLGLSMLVPLLGGAGPLALRAPAERPSEGIRTAALGGSAALVFAGAEIAAIGGGDPAASAEYRRNDRHLSHNPPRAITAIDQWPQRAVPDLTRRRITTLSINDRSFVFFVPSTSGVSRGGFTTRRVGPLAPSGYR